MKDWLAAQSLLSPKKTALYFEGERHSFSDLNKLSSQWTARLKAMSIDEGSVVALLLDNSVDFVAITFAVMRLGAVLLPLNTRLTAEEIQYQLIEAEAKIVLMTSSLKDEKRLDALSLEAIKFHTIQESYVELEPIYESNISLENRFCILFTSGTTGKPKAVCLSLKNFYYSANASAYRLGLLANDNWLCAMPLYHVGGLSIILRSCLYGTSVTLHRKFDLQAVSEELSQDLRTEDSTVTLASLVPTMLYRILNQDGFSPSDALRLVLLGGAAASKELLEVAEAKKIKVAATYGLSEACSQVATVFPDACYDKVGTVGKALMFTDIQIVDTLGVVLEAGELGEIQVRGPTIMQGYLGTERKESDWFATGDIGYLDSDGDLFIKQRRSDLIVSGGENVYPVEVEAILRQSVFVKDVVVFALTHPEWGQQVAAAVILNEDVDAEGAEIDMNQLCVEQLAGYKQPKTYVVTTEFPMTASGKVKRLELPYYLNLEVRPIEG